MATEPMTHQIASTEYIDGVRWAVMYCGLRVQTVGSDTSEGMAMPDACPDCEKAKGNIDDAIN